MIPRNDLLAYLDTLLNPSQFQDYCPNGLQVEGSELVSRIVCGVTASEALIDQAIEADADMLIVHHGYFWKGESQPVTGIKRQRLMKLLQHNINLVAYHLPLDAHPHLGNNAQLADKLGFKVNGRMDNTGQPAIGWWGELSEPLSPTQLAAMIHHRLDREPLVIAANETPVQRLGWCTGAAQGFLWQAVNMQLDAFISGEISEPTVHLARETGVHYFAAGHHATERYGIKALGEHLAAEFDIEQQFIDIDNPV